MRPRGLAGAPSPALSPKAFASGPKSDPPNNIPGVPAPGFYPADLDDPDQGPVVTRAQAHPVYINSGPSDFGNPAAFLDDLAESSFIHVVDQYTGSNDDNRYTRGLSLKVNGYPITGHTLQQNDLIAILHAAASVAGHGYGHIYHLFVPKGVDVCVPTSSTDPTPECYSPDNAAAFVFCAFHDSVTFLHDPVDHVLFTVEPYQDVLGCSIAPGSVNGALIDSTDDTLSHETFETITDPDGTAWWVHTNVSLFGDEIGDLCSRFIVIGPNAYFSDPVVRVGDDLYNVQAEYSNGYHACAYQPTGGPH